MDHVRLHLSGRADGDADTVERNQSGSQETPRWRETDSNPRSPIYGELAAPGRALRKHAPCQLERPAENAKSNRRL
jgi:hypothetical protein